MVCSSIPTVLPENRLARLQIHLDRYAQRDLLPSRRLAGTHRVRTQSGTQIRVIGGVGPKLQEILGCMQSDLVAGCVFEELFLWRQAFQQEVVLVESLDRVR